MEHSKVCFKIVTQADIAIIQARLKSFCQANDFSKSETGRVVTAASELSANVVKHARKGKLSLKLINEPRRALEVLVIDSGSGIPNIDLAMTDGFSSCGTLGLGLPGVKRMTDEFKISSSDEGTIVSFRIYRIGGAD